MRNYFACWVSLAFVLISHSALWAQPVNDTCQSPTRVSLGVAETVDLTGATTDSINCVVTDGVWYEFTATTSALHTFEYSAPGAVLAVLYSCPLGQGFCAQTSVGQALIELPVSTGETLSILVGGGSGSLVVNAGSAATPVDTCATAGQIELTGIGISLPSAYASLDPLAPPCVPGVVADSWLEFTAPLDGQLRFSSRHSGVSSLELYDACGGALLGCASNPQTSVTTYSALAGDSFVMRVTVPSTLGSSSLNVVLASPSTMPPNDTCSTALPIPGVGVSIPYDSTGATPKPSNFGFIYGEWYEFTAPGPVSRRYVIYRDPHQVGRAGFSTGPSCFNPISGSQTPILHPGETRYLLIEGHGHFSIASRYGFVRGDLNGDHEVDLLDAIELARELGGGPYEGGPLSIFECPAARDLDFNDDVSFTDLVALLQFLFVGGAPPAEPWPACGVDPAPLVGLECQGTTSCNPL